MTVLNPPIAVQARADHAADDLRGAMQSARMAAGGTLLPRQGIVPGWGAELSVAQRAAGANMSVDVGSGIVLLPAPTAGHGGWPLINDAALNLAIAAAHATLPRIDLVIARVGDAQYYAGGDGLATIKVITGTAAASPTVPAVPTADGAYQVLGQVAVAAAATSITNANISQNTSSVRPYSVAAGGILPVANAAARTALPGPHLGLHVIEADTGIEYLWTGSGWRAVGPGPLGTVGYAQVTADQAGIASAQITGLTYTLTTLAGRRYRVRVFANLIKDSSAGFCELRIMKDGAIVSLAYFAGAANSKDGKLAEFIDTPAAGSHTYRADLVCSITTATVNASATFPAFLLIEDIGV